ncbi:MAG: hypothetical protein IPK63_19735 [Candidatus Competibacteraceae bacterium]|nr:hypothetical protein [Candidatus Competibacteraceae bacterium]
MSLIQYLNPQRYLSAALGWAVFLIISVAALVGANLAAKEAAERARADAERLLSQFATQIRQALDTSLENRLLLLQATAAQIAADQAHGVQIPRWHQNLETLRVQFPEFVWLGVADERGQILTTAGQSIQDQNVAARSWFQKGREGQFLGSARDVPLLDEHLADTHPTDWMPGFVAAVPLARPSGEWFGVLGARLSWEWIERQERALLSQLETSRPLDLLLATRDRMVVLGPPKWLGHTVTADNDLSEGGRYVVCHNAVPPEQQKGFGWVVVVRQAADVALARARLAHRTVFWVVLSAGLISALVVVFVTHKLTLRLAVLDTQAQAVRQGGQDNLTIPAGKDEIGRIGATLNDLVSHLQHDKQALATLNAELDARVAERTVRIERLAEEARHAAITRERLRLARELHDTLAHSLMALLTQIRVIRKLYHRLDPAELDAELGQAEAVATTGLADARAAITQMRHNSVRDEGLGSALQQLLNRFQERSGVNVAFHADTQAAGLADERAETVFRIVEEALNNIERHAEAKTVQIILQWIESLPTAMGYWNPDYPAQVRIEIADDGIGFDPTQPYPNHYGLRGMREQAGLIEARLDLNSQPGAGTRIVLQFEA